MADEKRTPLPLKQGNARTNKYDDPSAKIWAVYVSEAETHDVALVESWKSDMDAILIFAGLFSGVITAFLIESYPNLQPDPTDPSLVLLTQIVQQLAVISNSSQSITIPTPPDDASFQPTTSALVCNALWFLSLAFSIACALSATFIQQWARNYLQATERRPAPHKRARIREFLYQGLMKFRMTEMVEVIPMLLHISILLFFAGLVEFLLPINLQMRHLLIIILAVFSGVYVATTLLPIVFRDCPYRTPFSDGLWYVLHALRLLGPRLRWFYEYWRDEQDQATWPNPGTMAKDREEVAMAESVARGKRDRVALQWTIESLTDDSELEPFVEGISEFLDGFPAAEVKLMQDLLSDNDARLNARIVQLLGTCEGGRLTSAARETRAVACLSALWSITAMTFLVENPRPPARPPRRMSSGVAFRVFPSLQDKFVRHLETINAVTTFRSLKDDSDLDIAHYAIPTTAVLKWSFFHDLVTEVQSSSGNRGPEKRQTSVHAPDIRNELPSLMREITEGPDGDEPLSPTDSVASPDSLSGLDSIAMLMEVRRRLRYKGQASTLKEILSDIRFQLLLEFLEDLKRLSVLPYEALNTIRLLAYSVPIGSPKARTQACFVGVLGEIIQPNFGGPKNPCLRIPDNIIDILLSFVPALTDPASVMEAHHLVGRYRNRSSNKNVVQQISPAIAPRVLSSTLALYACSLPAGICLSTIVRLPQRGGPDCYIRVLKTAHDLGGRYF